ncbi:MAG: DUF493 family protein [Myxococcota bacterium]
MANFRRLLDEQYEWPSFYTFKFIVPAAKAPDVERLFPPGTSSRRPSSKGNYISVSATMNVGSADSVIAMYEEAASIEGIIAL